MGTPLPARQSRECTLKKAGSGLSCPYLNPTLPQQASRWPLLPHLCEPSAHLAGYGGGVGWAGEETRRALGHNSAQRVPLFLGSVSDSGALLPPSEGGCWHTRHCLLIPTKFSPKFASIC